MMHNIGGAARQRIFEAGQMAESRRQREMAERDEARRQAAEAADAAHRVQAACERFAEEAAKVAKVVPIWRRIVGEVCEKYGVALDDLTGKSRVGHLIPPRQECFYRLFTETTMSNPAIGRRFNRDHTTVLHGVRKYAAVNGLPPAKDIKWANGLACRTDTSRLRSNSEVSA